MPVFRRNAVRMWALLLALSLLGGCTSPAVEETPSPTPESPVPTATASVEESAAPLTREEAWLKDIEAFSEGYKTNHIDLFYWRDEAFFDQQVEELKTQVGDLTDDEIVVSLARIINSMQDAHSSVVVGAYVTQYFPFELQALEDGLYILNVLCGEIPDYSNCLYAKVIAVNGVDAGEIEAQLRPIAFGDRYKVGQSTGYGGYFRPQVLTALGVPNHGDTFTFTLEGADGAVFEQEAEPIDYETYSACRQQVDYSMLFETDTGENWYTCLEDGSTLYFAYNTCSDPDGTLNATLEEILAVLKQGQVETLIVDLRNNSGGNSGLIASFVKNLRLNPHYYENFYIVIDGYTFSAGVDAAGRFSECEGAVLIGEPTRQYPDDLGDSRQFVLPHSGLICTYSIGLFLYHCGYREVTDDLPRLNYEETSIEPDIYIANDIDAWKGQYDNVLNYILEHT